VGDVRRLAYNLRPPVLDELGLLAAVDERARQVSGASLQVEVRAPAPLPALSAAVEVAAYRIFAEALMNVVRHAQATTCTVQLSVREGALQLAVVDDGRGLSDVYRPGLGLTSMRERAEEVGGSLAIDGSHGTRVTALLPLRADVPSRDDP
jgi:signal transduction histidine kinase